MTTDPTSDSNNGSSNTGSSSINKIKIKRDASEMMTTNCDAPFTSSTAMTKNDTIAFSNTNNHRTPLSRRQRGNFSTLLTRKSPFGNETGSLPVGEFDVSNNDYNSGSSKILVVGAGGLGCEILKDLAMCACGDGGNVRDVVVMDLGEFHDANC
jgi:hypothetical protein